jgi:hypothetical protein
VFGRFDVTGRQLAITIIIEQQKERNFAYGQKEKWKSFDRKL